MSPAKAVGRPERIDVRLTAEEREMLDKQAARAGLSTSDYIRQLLRQDAKRNRNDRKGG